MVVGLSKHSHMRPFANFITLNELVHLVMAHAFTLQKKWMAKDIYDMTSSMNVFPMSSNQTYVYRIMKNLAQKDILFMESTWSTTERPTLHYTVMEKGLIHFYTGERAVIKAVPAKVKQLRHFLHDLDQKLPASPCPPSPLPENEQEKKIIGVADYYDWLLLRGALDGKSPHSCKDLGDNFGKPVNLSYLYQLHEDLEQTGHISDDWITCKGREKLAALECELKTEVQEALKRVEKLEKTESSVKSWVKAWRQQQAVE